MKARKSHKSTYRAHKQRDAKALNVDGSRVICNCKACARVRKSQGH